MTVAAPSKFKPVNSCDSLLSYTSSFGFELVSLEVAALKESPLQDFNYLCYFNKSNYNMQCKVKQMVHLDIYGREQVNNKKNSRRHLARDLVVIYSCL